MRVGIVAYEGCLTSVVSGLVDTFALATTASARLRPESPTVFSTTLVTPSGQEVVGSGGFTLKPQARLGDVLRHDVVAIPPMGPAIDEVLARETALIGWLNQVAARVPLICSVCTGAFLLAAAGVLDGRRATTNAWYGDKLRQDYPLIEVQTERRIIDERSVISAGTTTSFLDLAIYLVDRFGDHDVAVWTAKALSKDKNVESQRPYFLFVGRRDHGDAAIFELQNWLQRHFAEDLAVEAMAARTHMSVRGLSRRFYAATGLAPMAYVRQLRIEAAKRHLEVSDAKVEAVCDAVGYADPRSFVRAFRAACGVTPSEYRKRFRKQS